MTGKKILALLEGTVDEKKNYKLLSKYVGSREVRKHFIEIF